MEGRRRITLYDQMTAGKTTSLADLILHDNVILADQKNDADADAAAATLTAAGSCQLSQTRTLVDILREDERHNNTTTDRKSRRAFNFMDKLRLKLALNLKPNYNSDDNNNNNNNNNNVINNNHNNLSELQTHLYSDELTQRQQNDVVSVEPENPPENAEVAVAGPVGVSLMDLLEETDMEAGFEVSSYRMSNADFEDVNECEGGEEEKKGEEEEGAGLVERNCCVCMVRHKGAAFIPCGHTFCRACSREVWVSRGNCPLCNNFILEILDIF